jgi:acyl-CoA reductase-like NAD-dependent aldehyde dehydrogenase
MARPDIDQTVGRSGLSHDQAHRAVRRTQLFIGGAFVDATGESTFTTRNPATGKVITEVAHAQQPDVDRAINAAREGLEEWRRLDARDRLRLMSRVAAQLQSRSAEFAYIECVDTGKPITDTAGDAGKAAERMEFFATMALQLHTDVVPSPASFLAYTLRQPVGVVAGITPWNFPLPFCGLKAGPALAAGNAVILKPAEEAPLSSLLFAEACQDAELPAGVVNVLPGLGETTGRMLVDHIGVDAISFTGSTEVGREIARRAGERLKKVVLELGGKAPMIVFADADLVAAARTAVYMFAYNQGQVCSAGTRLLVESSVADDFLDEVVRQAQAVCVGDPLDPLTAVGAVISERQLARIESYVEAGRRDGAELLCGGVRPQLTGFEQGWFYSPTVFANVRPEMSIAQEEIFGPVLSILRFATEAEAVALANEVIYGLTAAVWTDSGARAHRLAAAIEAGVIFVNTMNDGRGLGTPVSGWKASGVGVEGGIEGLLELTQLKSVIVNLGERTPGFPSA